MRSKLIILLCTALMASLAASAQPAGRNLAALPNPVDPVTPEGVARPLPAWIAFCGRYPSECEIDLSEEPLIHLDAKAWQTITAVNRRVNNTIKPMTDTEHWGIPDRWDLAEDGFGDCEDYQLLKRKLLADAGLPRRAMRMTVVIDERNEGHAVLMLRTDRGDFVLDNKVPDVLAWQDTPYVFVKREGQDAPGWVSLGRATSPVTTTANR